MAEVKFETGTLVDQHFEETIEDFICIYSNEELAREPWLRTYVSEQLARWGRWAGRGRAPALCFEAACVGALKYMEKAGLNPTSSSAKADKTLARILAGIVIDDVEPMAREQGGAVREKAVNIVADEFLARAAAPKLSKPAKLRLKKRKSGYRVSRVPSKEEEVQRIAKPIPVMPGKVLKKSIADMDQSNQDNSNRLYSVLGIDSKYLQRKSKDGEKLDRVERRGTPPTESLNNSSDFQNYRRKGSAPNVRSIPMEGNSYRSRKVSHEPSTYSQGEPIVRSRTPQSARKLSQDLMEPRENKEELNQRVKTSSSDPFRPSDKDSAAQEQAAYQAKLILEHFGVADPNFILDASFESRGKKSTVENEPSKKITGQLAAFFPFGKRRASGDKSAQSGKKVPLDDVPKAYYAPPDWKMSENLQKNDYSGVANYSTGNNRPRRPSNDSSYSSEVSSGIRPRKSSADSSSSTSRAIENSPRRPGEYSSSSQQASFRTEKPGPSENYSSVQNDQRANRRQDALSNNARRQMPRNPRNQSFSTSIEDQKAATRTSKTDKQGGWNQRKPSTDPKGLNLLQSVLDDCEDYLQDM